MVNTHNGWGDIGGTQPNGTLPPPPPTLAQAIASILESRDKDTELLRQLVVAMGLGTPKDRLQPPMQSSWQLNRQPSPKQENRLRPIIGFVSLSPSSGSSAAPNIRRHSLQRINF
jgi:hypothetical protein